MKRYIIFAAFILIGCIGLFAQNGPTAEEMKYVEVLKNRSDKILDKYLQLPEGEVRNQVRDLMVKQYRDINRVHEEKQEKLKALSQSGLSAEKIDKKKQKIEQKADKQLSKLQKRYLKNLSKYLSQDQIVGIKNGMTLGAFEHNLRGFTELIPHMTPAQKEHVYNQLVEARDKAMNMGSSEEKQAVFRQYKGRINNYLSQQGYDLDKERAEWKKRIDEAMKQK